MKEGGEGYDYFLFLKLYIPHGSDERNVKAVVSKKEIKLYIPHGSDESFNSLSKVSLFWTLYPTWFRWKF